MALNLTGDKNILSKLLAQENIQVRVSPMARTASFNVEKRILSLPDWKDISNFLVDMLIVHEVGHALYTASDDWTASFDKIAARLSDKLGVKNKKQISSQIHGYLNVIEDCRIDKLMRRRYPGTKKDYVEGHKELFERDFFNFKTDNIIIDELTLIDRINVLYKGGRFLNIKFNDDEMVFVNRIDGLQTFDDVERLSEDIYTYSFIEQKTQPQEKLKTMLEDKSEDKGENSS